jgi:hypothetical protein
MTFIYKSFTLSAGTHELNFSRCPNHFTKYSLRLLRMRDLSICYLFYPIKVTICLVDFLHFLFVERSV